MKAVWIEAYAVSQQNERVNSSQTQRIKIYEREEHQRSRILNQIRPFQRLRFWRKIYERTAEDDTVYGLDGYFISSRIRNETEDVALKNTSIVWRDLFCYKMDYLHPSETGRNLKFPPDILKTIWNHMVRPSSESPQILNIHLSGSNFEGLDVPPAIKGVRLLENGSTVTQIEQCDTDYMVVVGGVSLSSSDLDSADGIVEIDSTNHGYLRIRLSENFLRENSEKLAHCIRGRYLMNNYFEAAFYNDLKAIFEKASAYQEKNTPASVLTVQTNGPAFNLCTEVLTSTIPRKHLRSLLNDFDVVCALNHPTWPCVANEWLSRQRSNGWPSNDLIARIKSYGSYVVATAHDLSVRPNVEFRFSFSVAEHLLAEELSFQQKQCYVSFKSAIKHVKKELERQIQTEIKVKSYHLKTIFFWACETIPAEEFESPSGWTKCFLFLIDQLLYCLGEKALPGYFIPRYNLLDAVSLDTLDSLAEKVSVLSRDPFSTVTNFLNTLVLYNGLQLNEVLETNADITDITWGLELLQNLVVAFDKNVKCRFWKKSCALEIFANWCKSHLPSTLSQCISLNMTLFDVVHLDIAHQFNLQNGVLKEFSDRERSADVIIKLALCYVEACNDTAYRVSYSEKAMLLFSQLAEKEPSPVNVIAFALFLHDSAKYEEASLLLKSATQQFSGHQFENIFEEARKINCLMEEIDGEVEELSKFGNKYIPSAIPIYCLLLKCYKQLDMQDATNSLLKEFESFCSELDSSHSHLSWYMLSISYKQIGRISHANEYLRHAVRAKLQEKTKPHHGLVNISGKCPHVMISVQYVFFMFSLLMPEIGTPDQLKALLEEHQTLLYNMPFTGSNLSKMIFLLIGSYWTPADDRTDLMTLNSLYSNVIKWSAMSNSPSLSNRLYYVQFLINCTTGRPALPILMEIVQKEQKNLISVIVWPRRLRSSVDDYIRKELDAAAEDECIVIPAIVYANYLLATLHLRLMQMDEHTQVLLEFQSLCQELESVYPLSYSLLGYAYEQSGRYAQAVSSHSRARELLPKNELTKINLSIAISLEKTNSPVRRSTSSDRSRLVQEKCFEAFWQMYSGLSSVVPDASMLETPEEMMKFFETGRTIDECYGCRFAELS